MYSSKSFFEGLECKVALLAVSKLLTLKDQAAQITSGFFPKNNAVVSQRHSEE